MRVDNDLGQLMCERKKEKCVLSLGRIYKYNVYYTGDFYTSIGRLMVLEIKIMQAATILCTLPSNKYKQLEFNVQR